MAKYCNPGSGATMGDKEYAMRQERRGQPPKGKQPPKAPDSNKATGKGMGKAIPSKKPR